MTIRVTVLDTESGKSSTADVPPDSYILITEGRCYVAHKQLHASGTTQLTLKVDKTQPTQENQR